MAEACWQALNRGGFCTIIVVEVKPCKHGPVLLIVKGLLAALYRMEFSTDCPGVQSKTTRTSLPGMVVRERELPLYTRMVAKIKHILISGLCTGWV